MAHMIRSRMVLVVLTGVLAGLLALVGGSYATGAAASEPGVTQEKVWERESIPFRTLTRETDRLDKGVRKVVKRGKAGVRVRVVKITSQDGVEVKRKIVRNFVARRPVARVVLVGTRVKAEPAPAKCDPNYSGACVPIASDVDCGGGSGNGPAYVYGTVKVIGDDIYGLDADGEGYGCD
jgi:resuscitation-promoting factor RpfB